MTLKKGSKMKMDFFFQLINPHLKTRDIYSYKSNYGFNNRFLQGIILYNLFLQKKTRRLKKDEGKTNEMIFFFGSCSIFTYTINYTLNKELLYKMVL